MSRKRSHFLLLATALLSCLHGFTAGEEEEPNINVMPSASPGGAGHALVFHDNVVVKTDFKDFPTSELTFEAWISTSDFCHTGAIVSYAIEEPTDNLHTKTKNYNHFVIFNPKNVVACHDFEFIDIIPDLTHMSCHAQYNKSEFDSSPVTGSFVERDGRWHHLAVTWSAKKTENQDGETIIYMDGMEVGRAQTGKRDHLKSGGALMLGGEQDCYGGCTDPHQGFYGLMDEVRIWKTVRSQSDILTHMRLTGSMEGEKDLVAYWKFDDPGSRGYESNGIARDSSRAGNDLDLFTPPKQEEATIEKDGKTMKTGSLKFKNNYVMNSDISTMPTHDISIEFWAKGSPLGSNSDPVVNERYSEFFSFATQSKGDGDVTNDFGLADSAFMDDAIRIERYLTEFNSTNYLTGVDVSTRGAISVHINANRQGNGKHNDNWLDFATNWVDDSWHHIAVTWEYDTGFTKLYFDGKAVKPFWRASEGSLDQQNPADGGVDDSLAPRVVRSSFGSLVLGQDQECYGGCFSPSAAYDGKLAEVRVWDRVLSSDFIQDNMLTLQPSNSDSLKLHFSFQKEYIHGKDERKLKVRDLKGPMELSLGTIAPSFQYSDAPLTDTYGALLPSASPGKMGYALKLHDKQVLMIQNFHDFPGKELTFEFWMWSIDSCREGVPVSYAHGEYEKMDNAFLIFNYNNWGVSVMEDEGGADDHNAGFGSTDGHWHHIAVTWSSSDGMVTFYDNGRPQWKVQRGVGKIIPSGGTLVIGREQDCLGGCFDSAPGAAGNVQVAMDVEYGPQDFFGIIEEMRVWSRVRTDKEIYQSMKFDSDSERGQDNFDITPNDKSLVAWWKFDEGSGYSVKDETGRGHTLRLLEEPNWVVPRWLASCGDGIMEGLEECDDGNRRNNDGCDEFCHVEKNWICDAISPSVCEKSDEKVTGDPESGSKPTDRRANGSGTASTVTKGSSAPTVTAAKKSKAKTSGVKAFFGVLLALILVALIVFIVYRKRETIYEYAPAVEDFVHASKSRFGKVINPRAGYTLSPLDPQVDDVSPEFVDSQQPSAYRPPGGPGAYHPLPDTRL